jgi:hypothetical protein
LPELRTTTWPLQLASVKLNGHKTAALHRLRPELPPTWTWLVSDVHRVVPSVTSGVGVDLNRVNLATFGPDRAGIRVQLRTLSGQLLVVCAGLRQPAQAAQNRSPLRLEIFGRDHVIHF